MEELCRFSNIQNLGSKSKAQDFLQELFWKSRIGTTRKTENGSDALLSAERFPKATTLSGSDHRNNQSCQKRAEGFIPSALVILLPEV